MIIDACPPRPAHLEHALDRLVETVARLALEREAPRQEKIVEEIAVIFRSASGPAPEEGDCRS